MGTLADTASQAAAAQRSRDCARVFAVAGEQPGDRGGLSSCLETERREVLASVGAERGDFAALTAFPIDDRDAITAEDRDEDGAAAAQLVTLDARLEGRQARLADLRETRRVRRIVHGGDLR